jgi:hypothetical protein
MPRRAFARVTILIAALAVAAFVVACGDDESSDPTSVAITASGAKGALTFEVPDEVDAGAAEITLTNSSEQGTDGQLIRIDGDYSEEEVIAELGHAVRGEPVADWFIAEGGPGGTAPGETSSTTKDLEAGTYYVVPGEQPTPPLATFEVTGDDGADLPSADATLTAQEYSFTADDLPSGDTTLLLDNKGAQWHHFLVSELADGKTVEDAKKFFSSQGGNGPPPIDQENVIGSTVMDGGKSQIVDVNLTPGDYVAYCFVSDKQGGPPHVVKGMVSGVTVSE